VKEIWTYDGPVAEAFCPQSVTLVLNAHDIDVSRGNMLIGLDHLPGAAPTCRRRSAGCIRVRCRRAGSTPQAHDAHGAGGRHGSGGPAQPHDARTGTGPPALAMNDIGEIRLRTAKPLVFDGYATNRLTGSFILIEQGTNATVAAGMLQPPREAVKPESPDYVI
jgi:sulfate adenylyltransferase subunit 1